MHVSKKRNQIARKVLSVFALLLFAGSIWAQNIKVTGVVKDNKRAPDGDWRYIAGTKTVSRQMLMVLINFVQQKGSLVFSL